MPAEWSALRSDGSPWAAEDTPDMVTLKTGVAQRDRMLGVPCAGGGRRWLRVSTAATRESEDGPVQYVVSSLSDETERHTAERADADQREAKRARIQSVLDTGGPHMDVQPIVDLRTRAVVGGEALARFAGALVRGIDADPARRALAAGLLLFAREIGACLVAEGVETVDELAALRDVGVTHGQGYYLGRPARPAVATAVPMQRVRAASTAADEFAA